ncbi:hypothetical protein UCRPC4_g06597 [Phaeomoniella chlamydospora]|uniref:Uncharacterized protein n=1 Tax=Phaeomoniella chlamydospora TaxID=158046 RepID=A0A0G2FSN9_PHACM|nr:hypothetical protein UCRPC4_g06597 [Phaeomoniella chlamydospora]
MRKGTTNGTIEPWVFDESPPLGNEYDLELGNIAPRTDGLEEPDEDDEPAAHMSASCLAAVKRMAGALGDEEQSNKKLRIDFDSYRNEAESSKMAQSAEIETLKAQMIDMWRQLSSIGNPNKATAAQGTRERRRRSDQIPASSDIKALCSKYRKIESSQVALTKELQSVKTDLKMQRLANTQLLQQQERLDERPQGGHEAALSADTITVAATQSVAKDNRIKSLEAELDSARHELTAMQSVAEANRAQSSKAAVEADAETASLRQSKAALSASLLSAQREIKEYQQKLKTQEQATGNFAAGLRNSQREVADLQSRINVLVGNDEISRREVQEAQRTYQSHIDRLFRARGLLQRRIEQEEDRKEVAQIDCAELAMAYATSLGIPKGNKDRFMREMPLTRPMLERLIEFPLLRKRFLEPLATKPRNRPVKDEAGGAESVPEVD